MPHFWGPKVKVECAHCGWTGKRAKRSARLRQDCPRCRRPMPHPKVFAERAKLGVHGQSTRTDTDYDPSRDM